MKQWTNSYQYVFMHKCIVCVCVSVFTNKIFKFSSLIIIIFSHDIPMVTHMKLFFRYKKGGRKSCLEISKNFFFLQILLIFLQNIHELLPVCVCFMAKNFGPNSLISREKKTKQTKKQHEKKTKKIEVEWKINSFFLFWLKEFLNFFPSSLVLFSKSCCYSLYSMMWNNWIWIFLFLSFFLSVGGWEKGISLIILPFSKYYSSSRTFSIFFLIWKKSFEKLFIQSVFIRWKIHP